MAVWGREGSETDLHSECNQYILSSRAGFSIRECLLYNTDAQSDKDISEIWVIRVMYKIVGNHLTHFFKMRFKDAGFQLSSQKNKQPECL